MKSKAKIFKLLIDEYGLDQAVRISGLSKLEFIGESGARIDISLANDILINLFSEKKFPTKYKNCQLTFDKMSNVVEWSCEWGNKEKTYTYATPFWDEDGIPVDTTYYLSDDVEFSESELEERAHTDIEWKYGFENLNLYEDWIKKFYLPQVHQVIEQHLRKYRNI